MFPYPDYTHYLNTNLNSFFLVTGGDNGNGVWQDLCRGQDATLTVDHLLGWEPASRQGQKGSIRFAGGTETASVPNGGGLNTAQSGMISLWVKWTSTSQETYVNISGVCFGRSDNSTFVNQAIGLDGVNPTTAKVVWRPYATGTSACVSATSPGLDIWRHILVSYVSGNHRLYMDGVLEDTGTTTGTMTSSVTTPLTIGSMNSSNLIGNMDCVRIFPERALCCDEEAFDEYQHTSNFCRGLLEDRRPRRFRSSASHRFNTRLDGLGGVSSLNPSLQGVR